MGEREGEKEKVCESGGVERKYRMRAKMGNSWEEGEHIGMDAERRDRMRTTDSRKA